MAALGQIPGMISIGLRMAREWRAQAMERIVDWMEAEITNFQAKPLALNPNDETIMTNDERMTKPEYRSHGRHRFGH